MLTNRLHESASTQNALLTGTATIFGLLLSPLLGHITFHGISHYWFAVIVMILCASFGGVAFFTGQKHLDTSITQIAFSSILLWGVILSIIFLGSHFSLVQAAGIVLLFVSIVLTQYRKGKRKLDAGVLWIIISALLFAGFQVSSAGLSKHFSTATYLLLAYGGPTLVVGSVYIRTLVREVPRVFNSLGHVLSGLLFAASSSFGYYVFSFSAYHSAPSAGVVVVLLTSQVILSVLLGIVFLSERDHVKRKICAGILAFFAGILIKVG